MTQNYLWKMPEDAQEPPPGFILTVIEALEPWVILERVRGAPVPEDLIPMGRVHKALEGVLNGVDVKAWTKWHGGPMPVPEGTLVDVEHRDGEAYFRQYAGSEEGAACEWEHGSGEDHPTDPADIVAYRRSPPRGQL